jgi:hypothetical protein
VLRIPRDFRANDIEELNKSFETMKGQQLDLAVPLDINPIGFGAFQAFLQFLFTWRRQPNVGHLIIDDRNPTPERLKEFITGFGGLIATVLAWNTGIYSIDGDDLKNSIRKLNISTMEPVLAGKLDQIVNDNNAITLPFFDHLPADRGLSRIVYSNGKLRGLEEFEALSTWIIDLLTETTIVVQPSFQRISHQIAEITYEAFDNTNKWARQSYTGSQLDPNVRGIYYRLHRIKSTELKDQADSAGLFGYLQRFGAMNHPIKERQVYLAFLEISIFDSGSGLVQRFSGNELQSMTLEQEFHVLVDCLRKHNTSHKTIVTSQLRGIGLHKIMDLTGKQQGFMTVRSGRMHLYRDFLKFPFYTSSGEPNYALVDLATQSHQLPKRPPLEGTVLTFILPEKIS